jgi:cation transport ATPase
MSKMDLFSTFAFTAWMAVMIAMISASAFLTYRYRNSITRRSMAGQMAVLMFINAMFAMVFAASLGFYFEQLVCIAIEILFVAVFVVITGYRIGKTMEKGREGTGRTLPEPQDAGCSRKPEGDE